MNSDATSPDPPALPARPVRSIAAWCRLLVPAAGGLALDLWSKSAAFPAAINPNSTTNGLHPNEPGLALIPKVLSFITTVNHGAVFGMGQGYGPVFVLFSFIAITVILMVFASSGPRQYVLHVALGLITAGALGNLYDRITFGVVRDFLRFDVSWFNYVFNVADSLLCIGVPLLMICWLTSPIPAKSKQGFPVEPSGQNTA
jgi:signal peptidase II